MPRKPRFQPNANRLDAILDGVEFLTVEQVALQTGLHEDVVRQAIALEILAPGKIGSQLVITRRDVKRWRTLRDELEITRQLVEGKHPLDIYFEGLGRWSLDEVTKTMNRWARLTGAWVIEGPRGSYARWLEHLKIVSLKPRMLRRLIELLLLDDYVRKRVRLELLGEGAAEGAHASLPETASASSSTPPPPK